MIEGRLKLDTWEKDGKKNSKLRVVGERMQLLGGRSGDGPRGEGARPKTRAVAGRDTASTDEGFDQAIADHDGPGTMASDDDIPF